MSALIECAATFPSYDVCGAKITPTTVDELLEVVGAHVVAERPCVIASQNLHGLRVMQEDPEFRALHALPETYVHIDGMPIVALCRLCGVKAGRRHRVTLLDLIWPLLRLAAASQWRVYWIGSTNEVSARGLAQVRRCVPGIDIAGASGYFDVDDTETVANIIERMVAFRPRIVLVGMGMGRQEAWILRHRESVASACFVTVGACLEYIAGAAQTPPRWMGRFGVEWLYRLVRDPRRFWRRYLVEPWPLFMLLWRLRRTGRGNRRE